MILHTILSEFPYIWGKFSFFLLSVHHLPFFWWSGTGRNLFYTITVTNFLSTEQLCTPCYFFVCSLVRLFNLLHLSLVFRLNLKSLVASPSLQYFRWNCITLSSLVASIFTLQYSVYTLRYSLLRYASIHLLAFSCFTYVHSLNLKSFVPVTESTSGEIG